MSDGTRFRIAGSAPPAGTIQSEGSPSFRRSRRSQPLPPLCAPALEHQPAVLGGHPGEKTVGLRAVAAVGLKSTLHDVGSLRRTKNTRRNLNTNGGRPLVSMRLACVKVPLPTKPVGSPPEVFHSCGKKCGKAQIFAILRPSDAEIWPLQPGRKRETP